MLHKVSTCKKTYPRRVAVSLLLVARSELVESLDVFLGKVDHLQVGGDTGGADRLG